MNLSFHSGRWKSVLPLVDMGWNSSVRIIDKKKKKNALRDSYLFYFLYSMHDMIVLILTFFQKKNKDVFFNTKMNSQQSEMVSDLRYHFFIG